MHTFKKNYLIHKKLFLQNFYLLKEGKIFHTNLLLKEVLYYFQTIYENICFTKIPLRLEIVEFLIPFLYDQKIIFNIIQNMSK